MTTQANSPLSLEAGEDLSVPFLRVKASGRTVYIAGASDYGIGNNQKDAASGEMVAVRRYEEGSSKMVASAATVAGGKAYAAAGGKVAPTGTLHVGTFLDAASGNNSVVEVLPHPGVLQSSSSSSSSSSST